MADLTSKYMGLTLRNPVIVGSSGLTRSLKSAQRCEEAGAGAVVLKSVFEEQIEAQVEGLVEESGGSLYHSEAHDYIKQYGRENEVERTLDLIRDTKRELSIPVIASINCDFAGAWTEFANRIEKAGADGLELNVFVLPCDPERDGRQTEQIYFDVVRSVRKSTKLPLAVKTGRYFSGLMKTLTDLSRTGISALVLFNRFTRIDFDIEKLEVRAGEAFSSPEEISTPLRWISILAGRVDCDLAATTGVHDGAGVVKQILAGAATVQLCSVLYRNGVEELPKILAEVESWMERHGVRSLDEVRGRLSQEASGNPAVYERVQFMKRSVMER
jgi:dihydroorotate dehydrogenase (fumarate)